MSPTMSTTRKNGITAINRSEARPQHPEGLVLEAWSLGFLVGSLIIMVFVTVAYMRKGTLLHKVSKRPLDTMDIGADLHS